MKVFLSFLFAILFSSNLSASTLNRSALVIGNSKYANLGSLDNTINDAKGFEKNLKDLGYKTKLVLDADEVTLRKAIKGFAVESSTSSIAVVFYAGHGAQINGENYLLPVDIEIPKRESDIQFSSIKVDDVINSLKSKSKVIFLDACRDNPALIKSLSKGRGSYRGGLAAAKSGSYEDSSSLFIAYATDSGNVAQDGNGQKNSPFTSALLKYMKRPISIDDMFSLVTKEVRLATKNTQRPYKYASLDGVVCLTGSCGSMVESSNIAQDSKEIIGSEDQEFQIAINSNDVKVISGYLEKYPDAGRANELWLKLAQMGWGWDDLWVLMDFHTESRSPMYLGVNTIKTFESRRFFDTKWIFEDKKSLAVVPKNYAYHIYSYVIDCDKQRGELYQTKSYDKQRGLLYDNQVGDPRFIKLGIDLSNTVELGNGYMNLVCKPETLAPLLTKKEIKSNDWERVYSLNSNVDYLFSRSSIRRRGDIADVLVKFEFKSPKKVSETSLFDDSKLYVPAAAGYQNVPVIRSIVIQNRINCKDQTLLVLRQRFFNDSDAYVGLENFQTKGAVPEKIEADRMVELMLNVCTTK